MRLYEVRVETVSPDYGTHQGYKHIAFCINENKAKEIAETFIKNNKIKEWWIIYGRKENHINVETIDRGKIIE